MASTISAGTSASTAIAIAGDTSGALALQTNNGTTAVTVDTSQRVGVGTTSPTNKLYVSTNSTTATAKGLTVANTNASTANGAVEIDFYTDQYDGSTLTNKARITGSLDASNPANGYLAFSTNNSTMQERMRIDSSGNVLIGNSTAVGTSTVYCYRSDANYNFTANNTNAGTQSFFAFRYNGSGVGSISGNNSNVTYSTSSDYRLKDNVAPMTGALAKVDLLKPVTYTWKLDGSAGQGFIAHELQELVPECVTGKKDAVDEEGNPVYQGIDTSFLVATLTAAIQELNAKVEAQATTIAELQAKLGA